MGGRIWQSESQDRMIVIQAVTVKASHKEIW